MVKLDEEKDITELYLYNAKTNSVDIITISHKEFPEEEVRDAIIKAYEEKYVAMAMEDDEKENSLFNKEETEIDYKKEEMEESTVMDINDAKNTHQYNQTISYILWGCIAFLGIIAVLLVKKKIFKN